MSPERRALISVSDKRGIVEFARALVELGFEVISTGGTMRALQENDVPVRAVSEVTGVPEILGGRVKTLHPTIFGGILAQRSLSEDMATLKEHGMAAIDVVAVNLYPFEQTVHREGATDPEIIEQIDIGGPSLLRAAAKNHRDIFAVVQPEDYEGVLGVLREGRESEGREFRRGLAAKVFDHCSAYDRAIADYMVKELGEGDASAESVDSPAPPESLSLSWPKTADLRYGENPAQKAAFYADPAYKGPSLAGCTQLQGKQLSYNNYLDGEAALEMIREFDETAVVILKHANPCGVGRGESPLEAFQRALACDPVSAFGGIVSFNRPVDGATAEAMGKLFLEVVIAPKFTVEAQERFAKKKNLRLLEVAEITPRDAEFAIRSIAGGILVQSTDWAADSRADMKVVTKAQPGDRDWEGLLFAWKVVRWVKSNAIVYASTERTLGVGAGQMSRIDAANFGLQKAKGEVKGAYVGSDAFIPFRDVVDLVAEAGVRGIIQPGGSIRDEESIEAADENGLIMVFTGNRHFRH